MKVQALALLPHPEPEPASLLTEALSTLDALRLEKPPAVLFRDAPDDSKWAGYCLDEDWVGPNGEVVIASRYSTLTPPPPSKARVLDTLADIYMHETAHRLVGTKHDPAFLAMELVLYVRAGLLRDSRPWWLRASLYDLQDWDDVEHCRVGEALDWAWRAADDLAAADMTAEAVAAEIKQRYSSWKAWKAGEPERRERARVLAADKEVERNNLIQSVDQARQDARRWMVLALALAGVLGAGLAGLVIRHFV